MTVASQPTPDDAVEEPTLEVANLYAKQLIEGDVILDASLVEHYRWGPIKRFRVRRTKAAHEAETDRVRLEQESELAGG